jgi:photosystem II stability/assembly factor-like uncharacterized protein
MLAAPAPANPTSIVFWDIRRGLLAAGSCRLYSCHHGTISLTSDGGRTFRVVLRTNGTVSSLKTVGPRGAIAQVYGGPTLRTLDGGRTWRVFKLRFSASFANAKDALGFRQYVKQRQLRLAVVATHDGGKTWQPRASPCQLGIASSALIDLVTPDLGFIVCLGEPSAGSENKAIFQTSDGGLHWHARGNIAGYGYPEGIAFATDGLGLLWEGRGTLFVTRDGGRRWTAEPKVAQPELDFGRGAAAFSGGRGFVLLGRGGALPARLLATNDAGRTWHVVRRWR